MNRNYCLLTLLFVAALSSFPLAEERPNIVFILADDMGYGDVAAYGCRDIQTVHLDRLAESGVRFTSGYSSHPYCSPMRAALMAVRYQHRFGYERNVAYDQHNLVMGLPKSEKTVASRMREAGYATAAIGKWHLGAAEPFQPNGRGFDFFFGFRGGGHRYFDVDLNTRLHEGYYSALERNSQPVEIDDYLTTQLTDEAIRFMRRQVNDQPFFLYLAYNAPHGPLEAPAEYLDKYSGIENPKRRVYAAMVHALDDNIGRILQTLEDLSLRKNTLVLFLSDNGGPEQANGSDNGPLRGSKGEVYEGGIRVPFMVSWPGTIPAGQIYDRLALSIDLMRTSLEVAEAPVEEKLEGVNLLPFLTGEQTGAPNEALFWRMENGTDYAVRSGPWKLAKARDQAGLQLYNLETDIGETLNLASQRPEVVGRLVKLYEDWNSINQPPFFPGYRDYRKMLDEFHEEISSPH